MTDELVKRLRERHAQYGPDAPEMQAADRIEQQAAEIAQLNEHLTLSGKVSRAFAEQVEQQAQLIRNLRETGDRLAGYSGHDRECAINSDTPSVCTCGYTIIINAWKELGS